MKYIICSNLEIRNYDSLFLVILKNEDNKVFSISESSKYVLDELRIPKTENELLDKILKLYDVERLTAKKDLNKLLDKMLKIKIIKICKGDASA